MPSDIRPSHERPKPLVAFTGIAAVTIGVLVLSPNGGWAFDDTPGAVADGYLVDNDGPAVDDAAVSGGRVRRVGHRIIGTY